MSARRRLSVGLFPLTIALLWFLPAEAASQDDETRQAPDQRMRITRSNELLFTSSNLQTPQGQSDPGGNQPSPMRPVFGALLGGVVGLGVGMVPVAACDFEGSDCIGSLALLAALEPVGMALGAHIGNRKRGSLVLDVLVSLAAAGLVLTIEEGSSPRGVDTGGDLLMAGAVQFGAVVLTERATGRHR